jgi:hypothetical protein
MTADQLTAQLSRWGVKFTEHPGWRTNNRAGHGAWGPVNGSMVHHTASGDGTGIVETCYSGRADLPGPLCTGVVHKDGTVTLVGNGRSNHAGAGALNVYSAVLDETRIPAPGADTVDGNAHFYGWECVNLGTGKDPWPDVQLEAMVRVQAAVCEFHGWGAQSVIGHLEWTTRKIDPRGFTMVSMRALVAAHLAAGPSTEDDVTPEDIEKIAERVLLKDGIIANPVPGTDNAFITLTTAVRNIETVARRSETAVSAVAKVTVDAVIKALNATPVDFVLSDSQVEQLGSSTVLAEAIAEKVAAKLAARLAS